MADKVVKDRQRWTIAPYFIVSDVVSTAIRSIASPALQATKSYLGAAA
jgi:hypothetical protein